MAQFRSQASEGNFQANQLTVPDEVAKLENEANRRRAGLSAAQAHLEKNREIFLRAKEMSDALSRQSAQNVRSQEKSNFKASFDKKKQDYELGYQAELRANQVRRQKQENTMKLLSGLSQTAFNLVGDIAKKNKEDQLKAINAFALQHNLDQDTLQKVSSLDRDMSFAEYQRTSQVQQWIEEGRSQEFINFTYNHLLKGGGYTNYIENAFVLTNQATKDAMGVQPIINDPSTTPEQKDDLLARWEADKYAQRSNYNGKILSAEMLGKHYQPRIKQALAEARRSLNGQRRAAVALENEDQQNRLALKTYNGDGTAKKPQALMEMFSNAPTKQGRQQMLNTIVRSKDTTLADLIKLRDLKYPGPNGSMVSMEMYPDSVAIIDQGISVKRSQENAAREAVKIQEKQNQEAWATENVAQRSRKPEGFTENDARELQLKGAKLFGPSFESEVLENTSKYTVSKMAMPVMREQLDEFMQGNPTLAGLSDFGKLPYELEVEYRNKILQLPQNRYPDQYDEALEAFAPAIKAEIQSISGIEYVENGYNSNDVQWYEQKQRRLFKDRIKKYSLKDPDNAIELAKSETLAAIKTELSAAGAVSLQAGIKEYRDLRAQDRNKFMAAQEEIREIDNFSLKSEARNAAGWLNYMGPERMIEQSEELRQGRPSAFFEMLGRKMSPKSPKAAWEVQNEFADIIDGLEPVKPPMGWEEIKDSIRPDQRQILFGPNQSMKSGLGVLGQALGIEKPVRASLLESGNGDGSRSFTGALTYEGNKDAYVEAGNAFEQAGFRVGEHSDFDQVDPVHAGNSYHKYDEAFDITHQTGDYEESINKTARLQELITGLDLFFEVIGPLSGDPNHATHLHLGGLKRPLTPDDIELIKSLE